MRAAHTKNSTEDAAKCVQELFICSSLFIITYYNHTWPKEELVTNNPADCFQAQRGLFSKYQPYHPTLHTCSSQFIGQISYISGSYEVVPFWTSWQLCILLLLLKWSHSKTWRPSSDILPPWARITRHVCSHGGMQLRPSDFKSQEFEAHSSSM